MYPFGFIKEKPTYETCLSLLFLWVLFPINCQQTIDGTIFHDGYQREYKLYIPASYNSNTDVPLVLSFHGLTSNANLNFLYTKFHEIADTAGFILAHLKGITSGVPTGTLAYRFLQCRRYWIYKRASRYNN